MRENQLRKKLIKIQDEQTLTFDNKETFYKMRFFAINYRRENTVCTETGQKLMFKSQTLNLQI